MRKSWQWKRVESTVRPRRLAPDAARCTFSHDFPDGALLETGEFGIGGAAEAFEFAEGPGLAFSGVAI
jgi:hypothetical protein